MDENITLTPRQREILCRLTHTNAQIAHQLGIAPRTVKGNLTRMYSIILGPDPQRQTGARIKLLTAALRQQIINLSDIRGKHEKPNPCSNHTSCPHCGHRLPKKQAD